MGEEATGWAKGSLSTTPGTASPMLGAFLNAQHATNATNATHVRVQDQEKIVAFHMRRALWITANRHPPCLTHNCNELVLTPVIREISLNDAPSALASTTADFSSALALSRFREAFDSREAVLVSGVSLGRVTVIA